MSFLERHAVFVKDQIFLQEKLAARYKDNEWRSQKHIDNAAQLRDILQALDYASKLVIGAEEGKPSASLVSSGLALTADDLADLPPELMDELSLTDTDKLEFDIIELIRGAGGVLPLNKILIGLFRKTGFIHKRPTLNARLYRMVNRQRLHNVPDQKGVYSVVPINADDARGMFGPEAGQEDDTDAVEAA